MADQQENAPLGSVAQKLSDSPDGVPYNSFTDEPTKEGNNDWKKWWTARFLKNDETEDDEGGSCFPIEPFSKCSCCEPVARYLPKYFLRVQNWAHLVLLIGVISSVILIVDVLGSWNRNGCSDKWCRGKIFPMLFVACCISYFVQTIKQYDMDLVVKRGEIAKAKDVLNKKYQETIKELQQYISKSMETEAALAERNFESKRRDLQRFLTRVTPQLEKMDGSSKQAEFLKVFRSFMEKWIRMFSECTIDPVNHPLCIATKEELAGSQSTADIAVLLTERVRGVQVKFLSSQKARDEIELGRYKSKHNGMVEGHARRNRRRTTACLDFDPLQNDVEASMKTGKRKWLHVGRSQKYRHFSASTNTERAAQTEQEDGFPFQIDFYYGRLVLLSKEHVSLLLALCLGVLVLFLEAFVIKTSLTTFRSTTEVVISTVCICFVLYDFMNIDIVEQLQSQLDEVAQASEKLDATRQKIFDFYENVRRLADMWLHRVVPRLELMHVFAQELEEADGPQMLSLLQKLDPEVALLEQSIPQLSLWMSTEHLQPEAKKRLGNVVAELARIDKLDEVLARLPNATAALKNDPAVRALEIDMFLASDLA